MIINKCTHHSYVCTVHCQFYSSVHTIFSKKNIFSISGGRFFTLVFAPIFSLFWFFRSLILSFLLPAFIALVLALYIRSHCDSVSSLMSRGDSVFLEMFLRNRVQYLLYFLHSHYFLTECLVHSRCLMPTN